MNSKLMKEVQFYFGDSNGNPFRFTMNKEIDDHDIDAVAAGTSLPYLQQAYNLPDRPEGSIDYLVHYNTSIDPYLRDGGGE